MKNSNRSTPKSSPSPSPGASLPALGYASRCGVRWYLHQGTTKSGKPRYFVAKSVGPTALAQMPVGFEFAESLNGVVSVRRVDTSAKLIPDADVELVQRELARHKHLRFHKVDVRKGAILICEPLAGQLSDRGLLGMAEMFGTSPAFLESRRSALQARARYTPVMRFLPQQEGGPGQYWMERMTYRGAGGWSYPLGDGPLSKLVRDFVRHIGTDELFNLM